MQNIHSYLVSSSSSEDPESVLEKDPDFLGKKSVYTSIRTYDKKAFRLDEHLLRLKHSARLLGFEVLYPVEWIRGEIHLLIERSDENPQFLRITATPSNLVIISRPLTIDESIYQGVTVSTVQMEREQVEAKTFPDQAMRDAFQNAVENGHHDVLLVNKEGHLTEGSRSNMLWIKGDCLYFCSHSLGGITQAEVIRCAQELFETGHIIRIEKVTEGLSLDDIKNVDEMFITQTSRGIIPVIRVNEIQIGGGTVGPKTKALRNQFHQHILHFAS